MSSFHLGEIQSDLLSSSSSDVGPVCTGLCFIWISKPVRRWSSILNSIFRAFFKECDYLRVPDEGIRSLGQWWLCAGGVMVSFIWFLKTFASQCAVLLGCSVQMAFEKLFTFFALNPNNDKRAPDASEAYSCLLSCIHSVNERHTGVTVAVWHLPTQSLGICYENNLPFVRHIWTNAPAI